MNLEFHLKGSQKMLFGELFRFDNVAPGQSYTLRVSSRLYRFPPRVIQLTGDLANVNFVGLE